MVIDINFKSLGLAIGHLLLVLLIMIIKMIIIMKAKLTLLILSLASCDCNYCLKAMLAVNCKVI